MINRINLSGSALIIFLFALNASATPLGGGVWNGWIQFADGDETHLDNGGYIGPGYGGQVFDAEYLFYKYDHNANTLSIGLQTGFNVVDGVVNYADGRSYYAGDLALSFDDDSSSYEYAVDFGLGTRDFDGKTVDAEHDGIHSGDSGVDQAGLYSVSTWNTHVYSGYTVSNPFAMDGGSLITSIGDNDNIAGSGTADGVTSYYRQVTFDLSGLNLGDEFTVDTHWTMSCGNDNINGRLSVEEPSSLLLMGLGLLSLGLVRLRKKTKV